MSFSSTTSLNLADGLSSQAKLRPTATAICLPDGTLNFRQLELLVWKEATLLARNGVRVADVVALACANDLALIIVMLACARIGATVISIPFHLPPIQRREMVIVASVRFLVTDLIAEVGHEMPTILFDFKVLSKSEFPIDISVRDPFPLAPWLIISGSGSTGKAK